MVSLAARIVDWIPATTSYCSDTVYLKPMVLRHLLKWRGRPTFAKRCIELHGVISNLRAVHAVFKLQPALSMDPEYNTHLSEAECVLDNGKIVITLIAACSAVQELQGKYQQEAITKILGQKSSESLPKAVLSALTDLNGQPEGTSAAKRRKKA